MIFDRLDFASDAVFLLWFVCLMLAIGACIGVFMVAKELWWRVGRRKQRITYAHVEELMAEIKANAIYAGPAYWPAMDRLREMWVEREEKEKHGRPT